MGKEVADVTPRCYMPIYIPVESPAERITKAKAKLEYNAAMLAKARRDVVPSDKDTDSNGKKDEDSDPVNNLTTMVGHMVLELRAMTLTLMALPNPGERGRKASRRLPGRNLTRRGRRLVEMPKTQRLLQVLQISRKLVLRRPKKKRSLQNRFKRKLPQLIPKAKIMKIVEI